MDASKNYEIIVVGAGHAGVEAALVSARCNKKTALVTLSIENIAKMPCNPSIGGPAKGIVVREIDALGGQMGITADKTALQFKMLNMTKGPGVQSLRVQSDKIEYSKMMQELCLHQENLTVIEGQVKCCNFENDTVTGITMMAGEIIDSKIVILTTGTYMSSLVMVSKNVTESGPDSEPTTHDLSASLREVGLETFRLKTGTPPRVKTNTIDFSKTETQPGTDQFVSFSTTTKEILPFDQQVVCYLTYTAPKTHEIIKENLNKSSMYSGVVKGVGPRYCPSIEDKLVRFSDKERHQLFLEPESLHLDTTYVQGFSTSLPYDIQEEMVHSLPGLENAIIDKYAYAIEYDAIDPLQLKPTLETMKIKNLFTAGQINGTSGYEEAAGQGLMAGINAVNKLNNKEPLVLRRDEAYIGVMIDDLVTKGTLEPYRLLTSRAEFRLLLRHDNADQRLLEKGYNLGIIKEERYQEFLSKMSKINEGKEKLKEIRFTPKDSVNTYLESLGYEKLTEGIMGYDLLKRPNVECSKLCKELGYEIEAEIAKQIEIEVKYEGYINKALKEANRLNQMEKVILPEDINYLEIDNLSLEGKQKLEKIRPRTMGQASRISGVNPADIAVLAIALEQRRRKKGSNED